MDHRAELSVLIERVLAGEGLRAVPVVLAAPSLRVDGVPHDLGDAMVHPQRDPFPGGLPWTLHFAGPAAERLLAAVPEIRSGRPGHALAARLLAELRSLCLRATQGRPRFSLSTIDQVEIAPTHVRLEGTCAPILLGGRDALAPVV